MKNVILTAISILAMVIIVSINTASAEQKHIVIEMGESGQVVSFPLTSEEISAIDARNAKLIRGGALNSQKAASRLKTIEMGESGQIVLFPMAPEEIVAEDAENLLLSEIRRKSFAGDRQTIVYEMAQSGILIEFPKRDVESYSVSIAKIMNP